MSAEPCCTSHVNAPIHPIQWECKVPSGTNDWYPISQTTHKVYITYGTPLPGGQETTEKRIDAVCGWGGGRSGEYSVTLGIHPNMGGACGANGSDDWDLMWTATGDCDDSARFMRRCVNMVGIPDGIVQLVRATTDAGAGNCLDLEWQDTGLIRWWLILDFDTGSGYDWNAWEGCLEVAGAYWAVCPRLIATDDYDMLKNKLPCQQYWVETENNQEPGEGDEWYVIDQWGPIPIP